MDGRTGYRHVSRLPWTALRAFEAAARLQSFKEAANELAVTPTAISHQIRTLEEHLGVSLFRRLHRALELTPAGERLAETACRLFGELDATLDDFVRDGVLAGPGMLTVSAVPSLASIWLVPRLHRFQALRPDIELRILSSDTVTDLLTTKSVDVALRYGAGPYGDGLHSEPLWPPGEVVPVCAPSLLAGGSLLREPADLRRCLLVRTMPPPTLPGGMTGGTSASGWIAWFAAAGVTGEEVRRAATGGPLFSSTQMALEAVSAGQGVALAPEALVKADLASGRLVQPFPIGLPDPYAYWLVHRADRREDPRIRAFAAWIRREAAEG